MTSKELLHVELNSREVAYCHGPQLGWLSFVKRNVLRGVCAEYKRRQTRTRRVGLVMAHNEGGHCENAMSILKQSEDVFRIQWYIYAMSIN